MKNPRWRPFFQDGGYCPALTFMTLGRPVRASQTFVSIFNLYLILSESMSNCAGLYDLCTKRDSSRSKRSDSPAIKKVHRAKSIGSDANSVVQC